MNWFSKLLSKPIKELIQDPMIGRRFCKVDMRGCMATVRHKEEWGTVVAVGFHDYWINIVKPKVVSRLKLETQKQRECSYLLVRYDEGGKELWEPFWWCVDHGDHLEYQI